MPRVRLLVGHEAEIAAAYRNGVTLDDLAATYGVSRRPIERMLRDAGVPLRRQGRPGPVVDEDEIVRLYEKTKTMAAVAREIGRDVKLVRRVLRSRGVAVDSTPGTRVGTPWSPRGGRRIVPRSSISPQEDEKR